MVYSTLPGHLRQNYNADPRNQRIAEILRGAVDTSPLQGGLVEGFSRLGQALIAKKRQGKLDEDYSKKAGAYQSAMARVLSGDKTAMSDPALANSPAGGVLLANALKTPDEKDTKYVNLYDPTNPNAAPMTVAQGSEDFQKALANGMVMGGSYSPPTPEEKTPETFGQPETVMVDGTPTLVQFGNRGGQRLVDGYSPTPPKEDKPDTFKMAKDLRKEFTDATKDFVQVRDSYGRILASAKDPSPAGDLALIFNYMKVLDPGSTVREGEFATAQNSAGIPAQIRAKYNQVMSGERLAPEQRQDFVQRSGSLYNQQEKFFGKSRDRYSFLAERNGIDPTQVVYDLTEGLPEDMVNLVGGGVENNGDVSIDLSSKSGATIPNYDEMDNEEFFKSSPFNPANFRSGS